MSILLIDDDLLTVNSYAELIESEHNIVKANSCSEALQHIGSKPAMIITDLNLPDGNGFKLAKHFHHKDPDCIVILMSANFPEVIKIEAESIGFKTIFKNNDIMDNVDIIESFLS